MVYKNQRNERLCMKGNIAMSNKEITQVEVFEKLKRREIKQGHAARLLTLSVRQVRRKLKKYKLEGAKSLAHKGRGKKSNREISQSELDWAMDEIRKKYIDFGPTLAHEYLFRNDKSYFSVERLRQEMVKEGLWKPKSRKKAHIHQLRERRACLGELVQLDGSPHDWFEGRGPRCNLNVAIDDATGKVTLFFSQVETTQDYFRLVEQYILFYGVPASFYVDKHSIFRVNITNNPDLKKPIIDDRFEGLTQFGRAMRELGIAVIFANTPQAKGRVERINQTLQDRLVKELRIRGISTIEDGNAFLPEFVAQFNTRFCVNSRSKVDAHRKLPKGINLSKILCIKNTRVLSKNLTFQYDNTIYQIKTSRSAYTLRKTAVTICERYDGSITLWDHKGQLLQYTTIKKLPSTKSTNSKQLNKQVDDILTKQKKNPWESDSANFEQNNWFYKPAGAV